MSNVMAATLPQSDTLDVDIKQRQNKLLTDSLTHTVCFCVVFHCHLAHIITAGDSNDTECHQSRPAMTHLVTMTRAISTKDAIVLHSPTALSSLRTG